MGIRQLEREANHSHVVLTVKECGYSSTAFV